MKMVFTGDEVAEIIKQHAIEKLGVPEGAIKYVVSKCIDNGSRVYILDEVALHIETENAVPA